MLPYSIEAVIVMSQIIVTLLYNEKNQIDLGLPDDIPCQILADAIARALKCDCSDGIVYGLEIRRENHFVPISPANSLQYEGVLVGSYLRLYSESFGRNAAYLLSTSGIKFFLKEKNTIGRRDPSKQKAVDWDLLPLAVEKVISRNHAVIQSYNQIFTIEDFSHHGTWVNGSKIEGVVQLRHNDIIYFGPKGRGAQLTFVCP